MLFRSVYGRHGERRGEEGGEECVFCARVVDQRQVEVAEWDFEVVRRVVFFGEVGGNGHLIGRLQDVDAATEIEGVVGLAGVLVVRRQDGGLAGAVFVADKVGLVKVVELKLRKSLFVAGELAEVVPSHGVHVRLAYLLGEG